VACAFAFAVLLGACGRDARDTARAPDSASAARPAPATPETPAARAASARALVDAINAAEIGAARLAATRATNADVRRLATSLSSGHRQRVADLPPNGSDTAVRAAADSIRAAGRDALARLGTVAAGAAFDSAYVASQIAAHERALAALDALDVRALPHELGALVQTTRDDVRRHLDRARALQGRTR
jgi:putative membrane protein